MDDHYYPDYERDVESIAKVMFHYDYAERGLPWEESTEYTREHYFGKALAVWLYLRTTVVH